MDATRYPLAVRDMSGSAMNELPGEINGGALPRGVALR